MQSADIIPIADPLYTNIIENIMYLYLSLVFFQVTNNFAFDCCRRLRRR